MTDQGPSEPDQGETPPLLPQMVISNLETVRVIADPIRLRILELLILEPQPVKRLAASLDMPQTKLYYHVNLLEEHGLIRVVSTRVVSGIIEKQYGAVARSYRIYEALLSLSAAGAADTVDMMFSTMLDGLKDDLRRALASGLIDLREDAPEEHKLTLIRMPVHLSPERAAELRARLKDLIQEFCPDPEALDASAPGSRLYHLLVAYFPSDLGGKQPGQE